MTNENIHKNLDIELTQHALNRLTERVYLKHSRTNQQKREWLLEAAKRAISRGKLTKQSYAHIAIYKYMDIRFVFEIKQACMILTTLYFNKVY